MSLRHFSREIGFHISTIHRRPGESVERPDTCYHAFAVRFAVIVFPGTWSDRDCQYVLRERLGQEADLIWHREDDLSGYDAIVLPGGFSYGDYLRCGAIARFSPVMAAVKRETERGK